MSDLLESRIARWWLLSLPVVGVLILVSMRWLDMPIAIFDGSLFHRLHRVGDHLGSPILVTGETLVATILAGYRIVRGGLPALGKVTVIACVTSLCAFALNEVVLKAIFGVQPPGEILVSGAPHLFHLFQGSWQSSFPSGHMALAAGFIATFSGQDRRLFLTLLVGGFMAAALLVLGNWHFLSDVIAGALVGGTAGLFASVLWRQHQRREAALLRLSE